MIDLKRTHFSFSLEKFSTGGELDGIPLPGLVVDGIGSISLPLVYHQVRRNDDFIIITCNAVNESGDCFIHRCMN